MLHYPIDTDNAYRLVQGGRAKWRIENETFNTLKNQGYQFEHNFGHGTENLSTVLSMLMMLAFLIDQAEQMCCALFQVAWGAAKSKTRLWELIRSAILWLTFDLWVVLYQKIGARTKASTHVPILDTS